MKAFLWKPPVAVVCLLVVLSAVSLEAQFQSTRVMPSPAGHSSFAANDSDPSGALSTGAAGLGITGRLIPTASRVEVDLYRDGARIGSTYTSYEGVFRFPREATDRRYEIHVVLADGDELSQDVEFQGSSAALIYLNQMQTVRASSGQSRAATGTVSVTNLMAPSKAQRELAKGAELAEKKKYAEALSHFQNAVTIYPKYSAAYNEIGRVDFLENKLPDARDAFQKAIEIDPKWPLPYINLAKLQLQERDIAGMMKTDERALDLNPSLSLPNFFNAVGFFSMGRLDDAEKSALLAERNDSGQTPQIQLLLADIDEACGNLGEALLRYKEYLKRNPRSSNASAILAHVSELETAK